MCNEYVKPHREALAQKAFEAAGRDDWGVANDLERDEWLAVADAVLDLLHGRSEAEVKAEALREAAGFFRDTLHDHGAAGVLDRLATETDGYTATRHQREVGTGYFYHLAAEGGDDRG